LQQLADDRVADADALLQAGRWSAAFYLCGYAIECALKACIAKQINLHDFPDKTLVQRAYTHELLDLLDLAGLKLQLKIDTAPAPNPLGINWELVKSWSERTRYQQKSEAEARRLFLAITDHTDGVMPWIKHYW
jgi:hypothetical protein